MQDQDTQPITGKFSDTPATDGVGGIDVPAETPTDFGAGEAMNLKVNVVAPQPAVPELEAQPASHTLEPKSHPSEHTPERKADTSDPLAVHHGSWIWAILGGFVLLGIFAFVVFTLQHSSTKVATQTLGKTVYSIPLSNLAGAGVLSVDSTSQLAINGQLRVNNSLILSPIAAPLHPTTGQMYLNKDDSEIYYYNGSSYVNILQAGRQLTSINGHQVNLALGTGLALNGNTLSSTNNPFTLQGQSGDVTLTNGGGISITGTTITNTGVTAIGGQSGSLNLTPGTGIGVNGLAITNTGVVGLVSASDTLVVTNDGSGNYTLTQVGVDAGNKVSLAPTTAQADSSNNPSLWINKTGTGNLLQLSTGTTPVDRFVVDSSGAILTGAIGWNQVTSKPNLINSIDTATGDLLLGTGLTRTGQTISISLPQDIATTATPTFAALNLTAPLPVTSGGTGATTAPNARTNLGAAASGANTDITSLAPTSGLTVGSTSQALILQGSTSTSLSATNGAFKTTFSFVSPSANVTYRLQAAAAGTYDVCTTAGNCTGVGGGVTTPGGTPGTIPKFSASQGIADSIISDDGSTVTIGGALSVNTVTPTAALTMGSTLQNLTLQGATTALTATSAGVTNRLTFATPGSGNKTITLPNATGTVAVSAQGPLSLDGAGNLTCPSCLISGGGGGQAGVSSLDSMTGPLLIQGTANQIIVTDTAGHITLSGPQDLAVASSPTFNGLSLTSLGVSGAFTTGTLGITTSATVGTTLGVTGAATAASFNGLTLTTNATGFSVAGGIALRTLTLTSNSTIDQNLATTASPTFAGLTLTSALAVANGGTGTNSLTQNGVLMGNGTSAVGAITTATPGQCLISTAGSPTFATCTGHGGVDSFNGLAGTLALQGGNTGSITAAGSNITIADATATIKGLAEFSATNLTVTSGSVNTVQDIAITASPTFAALSITGAATAASLNGQTISNSANFLGTLTAASTIQGTTINGTTGLNTGTGSGAVRIDAAGLLQNVSADVGILTSGTLAVNRGGTGTGSFTGNGIIYGNGIGALQATNAGSTGQCLVATTGAAPTWGVCGSAPTTTLQNAYDNSSTPATITTSSTSKGVVIQSGTGNNAIAFQVTNDSGANVLSVDTANRAVSIGGAAAVDVGVSGKVSASSFVGGDIDVTPQTISSNKYVWSAATGWIDLEPTGGGMKIYMDHVEGYVWSENIGWIWLGTHTGGGTYTYANTTQSNYGVNRSAITGALSGYAWSTIAGWINFSPTNGGVSHNAITGTVTGYAWGDNIGWINFNGVAADTTPYNPSVGIGSGTVKGGDFTGANATFSGTGSFLGSLGVGTASPQYKLDVQDSQATNYVARLQNTNTGTDADGLLIDLGVANASRTSSNYFIGFSGNGTVSGMIQGGANAVAYTTTGADYAEYFKANSTSLPQAGEIVSLDTTTTQGVIRAQNAAAPLVGVVSTSPGFVGNGPICAVTDSNCGTDYAKTNSLVALSGQVPTKVDTSAGDIAIGDPITASATPGVGAKATHGDYIIGYALEPLAALQAAPSAKTTKPTQATIKVLIRPQRYGPSDSAMLQSASLILSGNAKIDGDMQVGGAVNVAGPANFVDLTVTGKATFTGSLSVQDITVANITIGGHIISDGKTPTITPGDAAGTKATASVEGNDTSGTVTVTTDSSARPSAGTLATLTFATPYAKPPHITLTPVGSTSAAITTYIDNDAASFKLGAYNKPQPNNVYRYYYYVIQ